MDEDVQITLRISRSRFAALEAIAKAQGRSGVRAVINDAIRRAISSKPLR